MTVYPSSIACSTGSLCLYVKDSIFSSAALSSTFTTECATFSVVCPSNVFFSGCDLVGSNYSLSVSPGAIIMNADLLALAFFSRSSALLDCTDSCNWFELCCCSSFWLLF
jgi:hypothetical protein